MKDRYTKRLDKNLGLTVEEAVAILGTDTVLRAIGNLPCCDAESAMRQHADEPTTRDGEIRRAWHRLAVQGTDSVRLVIANAR